MIAELNGKIISKSSTEVIISCGGVGYMALISVKTSEKLPARGKDTRIHTLLIPRDDALNLYGFADTGEREAFKMLVSVSGIGAKIALGILSSLEIDELQEYVIGGNTAALSKLPGIGKKTAERIILELREKIQKLGAAAGIADTSKLMAKEEAVSALVTLGYGRPHAEKAVGRALKDMDGASTAEELIKLSLKYAMK